MEETILIKGIALFSALAGLQQWVLVQVNPADILFIALIVAFLISVECDYLKHKKRIQASEHLADPINTFFLRTA